MSNVHITKSSPADYADNPVRGGVMDYTIASREYRPAPELLDWRVILARAVVGVVVVSVYGLWKTFYCWSWTRAESCASIAFWEPFVIIMAALIGGTLAVWHYAARNAMTQAQATRTNLVLDRFGNQFPADLFQRMSTRDALIYLEQRYTKDIALKMHTAQYEQYWSVNTLSGAGSTSINTAITPMLEGGDAQPLDPFEQAVADLPRLVDLENIIDMQPGPFSVPFGVDHTGTPRWFDMRKDMLHVGIFGGSGAGKDNLLESWFVALTTQNAPDRVQFAVLDGKGHWMQPRMSKLAHMWLPPAGGIGDEGQRALQAALTAIQTEAARRGKLVFGADCNTMEQYSMKTGDTMPYLVVMISDVMGNITGDVDKLLVDLVSKARALGMRIIVSMQTPTKQNMQWRTNLSTVLSGQMQGQSNDTPALGIAQADMLFPPSRLPEPKTRPGIFSVRSGQQQLLIQAPLVREGYYARHIADLPVRNVYVPVYRSASVAQTTAQNTARASMFVPTPQTDQQTVILTLARKRALIAAMKRNGRTRDEGRAILAQMGVGLDNNEWTIADRPQTGQTDRGAL